MLLRWRGMFVFPALLLIIGQLMAQSNCPALVEEALQNVTDKCYELTRNQVCYGNLALHATPRDTDDALNFDEVGDIVDVSALESLKADPLNAAQRVWGLAMMQLQADIPDALPGQNVTFLLFGDVEIQRADAENAAPMQAFYLRTGVGDAGCVEAPESGVIIQTPHGVESVHFTINGVEIEIGSTVMLQAQPAHQFTVRTLEGAAVISMGGNAYPVIAGTESSIPLNEQMQPVGTPSLPAALPPTGLEALPLAPLPREIPAAAPLPEAVLLKLQMRLESGLEPCGVPALPACEHSLAPHAGRIWAVQNSQSDIAVSTPDPMLTSEVMGNPTASPDNAVVQLPTPYRRPASPTATAAPDSSGSVQPPSPPSDPAANPPVDVPPDPNPPADPGSGGDSNGGSVQSPPPTPSAPPVVTNDGNDDDHDHDHPHHHHDHDKKDKDKDKEDKGKKDKDKKDD